MAIETFSIIKYFKNIKALDNITINIKKGEFFSILGPNGAGKTTLINILTTLLKPTSGKAYVCGIDVVKNPIEVRKNIGIVFQEPSLDDLLTAEENLILHGILYGMNSNELTKKVDEILKMVGLYERKKDQVKTFSGGMKRRLEIARGILHLPKVLFLDEPTLGLDPASRRIIWNYLIKIKEEKKITIILTTHYMEEAEFLSDRIAIINKGKIIELDTPQNLKRKIGDEVLKIKGEISIEKIKELSFIKSIYKKDDYFIITSKNITTNLSKILEHSKKIEDIELKKTSLEDVFLNLTGKKIEELDE